MKTVDDIVYDPDRLSKDELKEVEQRAEELKTLTEKPVDWEKNKRTALAVIKRIYKLKIEMFQIIHNVTLK